MKKVLCSILTLMCLIVVSSCSEDFNVKAPIDDVYVLNCVLRSDDSVQYAIITKNYDVDGLDPYANKIDPSIAGAQVRIFYNDSVYIMRDTVLSIINPRYNSKVYCYYIKNLVFTPDRLVKIEAKLPNGSVLESSSMAPRIYLGQFQRFLPQINNDKISYKSVFYYDWGLDVKQKILCVSQIEIYYQQNEDGILVDKMKVVPLYYNNEDDVITPVYSQLSYKTECFITIDAFNRAMQEISEGDNNKKNYIINKALFTVRALDVDLSKYYSAYLAFEEAFTIKIRSTDISNVQGGKGIFGLCYKTEIKLTLESIYVNSFGYQYNPTN